MYSERIIGNPHGAFFSTPLIHLLILFLLSFVLFFYNLGGWDLWTPDEPRYAQVAREMAESGNWILPRLNNRIYPDKPPVFFWLIALSYTIFGEVSSFTARFPSALAGMVGVLITYVIGCKLKSPRSGFISALVLATTVEYFWLARRANIDMTLTLFIVAALFFFYKGYKDSLPQLYYLAYLFIGLATLTKGPVGFILPLLTVIAYLAAKRDLRGIKRLIVHPGIIVFFVLVLAWCTPAALIGGKAYRDEIIFKQILGRVYESWSHQKPFYYYFLNMPPLLLPWIFFFPGALWYGFSVKRQSSREDMLFPVVWFTVVFVFFSLCSGKRTLYLLPLLPACALMVGLLWDRFFDQDGFAAVVQLVRIPCCLLLCALIAASASLPWLSTFFKNEYRNFDFFLPSLVTTLAGTAALITCIKNKKLLTLAMLVAMTSGGFIYAVDDIFPVLNGFNSAKPFALRIKSIVKNDDVLVSFCAENTAVLYYSGIKEVHELQTPFELTTVIMNSPRRVFCLIYKKDFDKIASVIPFRLFQWDEGTIEEDELLLISNHERS